MNMEIYNRVRSVPNEAKKTITGGRLNGFTDINPMWRIQVLTETFGTCGFGWGTTEPQFWEQSAEGGEVLAFCKLGLWVKVGEERSGTVWGIGGSKITTKEKSGLVNSDEAYKMAYTDALSVCAKMLGVGADVYWNAGTKYTAATKKSTCHICGKEIANVVNKSGAVIMKAEDVEKRSIEKYGKCVCVACAKTLNDGNESY